MSMIPLQERAALERALSKNAEKRWPSCREFVARLFDHDASNPPRSGPSRVWLILLLVLAISGGGIAVLALGLQAPVAPEDGVSGELVFDGKSRIVTPVERFAPVTLEAWINPIPPAVASSTERYVIGSDVKFKGGICLGLAFHHQDFTHPPRFFAMILPNPRFGDVPTGQTTPFRDWTHLAGVFGKDETVLYLNGKEVGRGSATRNEPGTVFVVGNAGKDNADHFFEGRMKWVRISRGARYAGEFAPSSSYSVDAETVAIYDAGGVTGRRIVDRSGNGNDGVLEGVHTEN